MVLKDVYKSCRNALADGGIENAEFEARCLLEHLTGFNKAEQLAHGEDEFEKENELSQLIKRRLNREPLQYILGSWSFCGFDFEVGEGVLIPRDDTEVVLGLCLEFLKNKPNAKVLDLCAGSGAISVAIARLSNAEAEAVELSDKAFIFLKKNIDKNHANVKPINGDIFECHSEFENGKYDLIVSNPPYIRSDEIRTLQAEVQAEPAMALDGGDDGYDFYEAIIEHWSAKLKHGGALAFELGEGQAEYVSELMKQKGFANIRTELDFGGTQRAIIGTML